jgi:hypothetical protein
MFGDDKAATSLIKTITPTTTTTTTTTAAAAAATTTTATTTTTTITAAAAAAAATTTTTTTTTTTGFIFFSYTRVHFALGFFHMQPSRPPKQLVSAALWNSFIHMSTLKIFGPKREEDGSWRKLHNDELHDLYSSPNIIGVIKSRRMKWAGHVARMGERRGVYRVLVGRPEGKRPLGGCR